MTGLTKVVAIAACAAVCDATQARAQGFTPGEVEQLAAQCASCHQVFFGTRARRASGVPDIRGQEAEELLEHLRDFKSGRRRHLIMTHIAGQLSEAEMLALSEYYAAQPRE